MNNEVVLVPKTMNTANNATNKTMNTLSCLSHVKRDTDGHRPPAPPAYVLLSAVVDRSGSMASMGNVPATGLRDFIAEHKKLAKEGNIIKFSLTTFDNVAETWYNGVDLATMPDISAAEMTKMVAPRGLTLLVDTFMERLHALERQVVNTVNSLPRATRDLKPKIVAILIAITDGQDNMSRKFTAADLNQRVKSAKQRGISVLFMGANQDAIQTAATYGIAAGAALTFGATPDAAAAAFRAVSQVTYRCASGGGGGGPAFTQNHRDTSAPASLPPRPRGLGGRGGMGLQRAAPLPLIATQMPYGGGGGGRGGSWGGGANAVVTAAVPPQIPSRPSMIRQQTVAAYDNQ